MKGLKIARAFYEQYGRKIADDPMFSGVAPYMAFGLCGSGSECLGYDDDTSADHDLEPGFILFLPGEDIVSRRDAFLLERAYAALPKEFMGLARPVLQPVGGARHGVIRIPEFLMEKTGTADGILTEDMWLTVPQQSLLEAVNGEIFEDRPGMITAARERLSFYPEDIRRKKLAGHLLLMAQSGQYNFRRCIAHGENGAAQLAAIEFARHTMSAVFLLNFVYEPYYKWSFRAMRDLPKLSLLAELMEYLITTDNEPETAEEKYDVIEGIAADVIDELITQDLTKANCGDLEKHAYSVNDGIESAGLRNRHILAGI